MNHHFPDHSTGRRVGVLDLSEVQENQWDSLLERPNPFLRYAFLHALETTRSVGGDTGWEPCHYGVWDGQRLVAALPAYRKAHSWGEYVFDWQWADAWHRAGGKYYPKLITAVPYTPSSGQRLLYARDQSVADVINALTPVLEQQCGSGWHLLFPRESEAAMWQQQWPTLLPRLSVQYHWHNRGYRDFDDFLARFSSKRRKEVKRERRKISEQGIIMRRLHGQEIDAFALRHFYRCYQITYLEHGQQAYLPFEFFLQLTRNMPEMISLVQALYRGGEYSDEDGTPVAAALFFHDDQVLYGRYWGSEVAADSLHFETCYYQGIELAIERGLQHFDPGTQGEHKIPRGFEPCFTHSLHWISSPLLRNAVDEFLISERAYMHVRLGHDAERLPFRQAMD